MKEKHVVGLFGVGCLTAIGIACVLKGIDATIILGVGAIIGTVVGYAYGVLRPKK